MIDAGSVIHSTRAARSVHTPATPDNHFKRNKRNRLTSLLSRANPVIYNLPGKLKFVAGACMIEKSLIRMFVSLRLRPQIEMLR